ncbi:MAG: ATP-binding cassette domain-containing protein [Myxococcota bacterium]|nr:ATP-binding cassette domain-containing protein [Myxococcota bacterium]
MTAPLALEAVVTKRYGAFEALRDARIAVRAGTVHALVGENGAGKSTLVRLLSGIERADGTLVVAGTPIELATWNRKRARAAGIGVVQQHGASAQTLTVVENAVLGVEGGPLLTLDATARALRALGEQVGLPIDPYARVEELSLGAAQRAEIVAALHHGATTLILDEPTAVLAPVEVTGLLATLRRLASEGKTIVIVTHKLDEVRRVADDVTVLREGTTVATFGGSKLDEVDAVPPSLDPVLIARAMVGEDLPPPVLLAAPPADAPPLLPPGSVIFSWCSRADSSPQARVLTLSV